jgi:hypothetical protein
MRSHWVCPDDRRVDTIMSELFVLRTITVGAFEIGRISDKNYFTVWDLRFGMNNRNCLHGVSALAHASARKPIFLLCTTSHSPVM